MRDIMDMEEIFDYAEVLKLFKAFETYKYYFKTYNIYCY